METRVYNLIEFDGLWKQYAALSVERELYDHITHIRAELEGSIMFTFPLEVDEVSYRVPHFAVVALVTEPEQVADEPVLRLFFIIREFNSEAFPDGQPVKEIKITGVPFDFEGRLWVEAVQEYVYALERARREKEIDDLD